LPIANAEAANFYSGDAFERPDYKPSKSCSSLSVQLNEPIYAEISEPTYAELPGAANYEELPESVVWGGISFAFENISLLMNWFYMFLLMVLFIFSFILVSITLESWHDFQSFLLFCRSFQECSFEKDFCHTIDKHESVLDRVSASFSQYRDPRSSCLVPHISLAPPFALSSLWNQA
jgi:hypothetical protein